MNTPIPQDMPTRGIDAITNPGEELVFITKKHILGMVYVFIQAGVGLLIAGGLVLFMVPEFVSPDSKAEVTTFIALGLVFFAAFLALILMLATYLYRQNKLIVSNQNVTQVIQRGLFSRKVSELSLGSVEDVTADKHGILAAMFDYGELRIETAGEQNNFTFTYCPHPNQYGQLLLDARQRYHQTHGDNAVS